MVKYRITLTDAFGHRKEHVEVDAVNDGHAKHEAFHLAYQRHKVVAKVELVSDAKV